MRHHWPGNVRELRNVADRIVLGLPAIDGNRPSVRSLDEKMVMFERHLIEAALTPCGGGTVAPIELLQVPKKTLSDNLKRLGLAADNFKLP